MKDKHKSKIGIIGAGAAGLAAAVTASCVLLKSEKTSEWQIDLLEKKNEPGKKILATGNGKCNLTNKNAEDFQVCEKFFNDLGILLAEESDGRMYPYSKQARTVRDTLLSAAVSNDVNVFVDVTIEKIEKVEDGFLLIDQNKKRYKYQRLILTTGGKAGMQHGSDGSGLSMVRKLGVLVSPILPALVPMTYGHNPGLDLSGLKGVRTFVNLCLRNKQTVLAKEQGELQFTDYGLSGICIFDLSRYLKGIPKTSNRISNCTVQIDMVPDFSYDELVSLFENNLQAGLKGVVNEKIEKMLLNAGIHPGRDAAKAAGLLKAFSVNIDGTKGWKEAQVTSGGVQLDQINMESMESKNIEGLFLAGEILDYDGPCGGYNLSWAWGSGIKAGLGAVNGIG